MKKNNSGKSVGNADTIDPVIHAPARLNIVATLSAVASADFMFLLNQVDLTRGNLSSHLSKLEAAGYVEIRKEFVDKVPRTLILLTKSGRSAFKAYRKQMKKMLA